MMQRFIRFLCLSSISLSVSVNSFVVDVVVGTKQLLKYSRNHRIHNCHSFHDPNNNCDNEVVEDYTTKSTTKVINRRNVLVQTSAVLTSGGYVFGASMSKAAAVATTTNYQKYTDTKYGFSIDIPTTWNKMNDITSLSDRRTIVVYTDPTTSSSLVIVYTPVRDDYTSLNSFGSVDQVALQTILPKGNLMDEDSNVIAQMISSISTKQSYIFDYIQQVPQQKQPLTHYRTIFTLCSTTNPKATTTSNDDNNNNSNTASPPTAGAMLITLTLQTPQSQYMNDNTKTVFDTIIDSYQRV